MQLNFEYIFADKSYPGMTYLDLGPTSDGYLRSHVWRSTDLGQTYRVVITEDPVEALTLVTITKSSADVISIEEATEILDHFYPARLATRQDNSGQGNSLKFSIWPGPTDLELQWRKQQLVGQA